MKKSVLNELTTVCPFTEVFEDKDANGLYRRKIGHIRADFDGYRWHNTVWPYNKSLSTNAVANEIDRLYSDLIDKEAFSTLSAMTDFCNKHPQASVCDRDQTEYNFYYEGNLCLFWLRCITREKDYNLYLHAFIKN